jgi:VanZ family protein
MNKRWVFVIFVLFWMSILVWFSLQPKLPIDAKEHAKWIIGQIEKRYTIDHLKQTISSHITWIEPGIAKFYDFYGMTYQNESASFNFIVRKLGHFSVYFILGGLLFLSLRKLVASTYLWTALIGLLFALFDELNQSYLSERTSMIQDVLVDFAGVVFALLFTFTCKGIYGGVQQLQKKVRGRFSA